MPGAFDAAHCDTCGTCTPPCDIFNPTGVDDYTLYFTELAGSWSYGDVSGVGYFETTVAPGGIYCIEEAVEDTWHLSARFKYTPGAGSSVWRMAAGAADANNYLFIQVVITNTGGNDYFQIQLGKVDAGVYSIFTDCETPYVATDRLLSTVADGNDEFTLELFYDTDGVLCGSVNNSTIRLCARNVTSFGNLSGLFVTQMNGTLRVSLWRFEHIFPEVGRCRHTVQNCTRGLPLPEVLVKFTDASPTTQSYTYLTAAGATLTGTFDCSAIPGTWTVVPNADPQGADNCTWSVITTGSFGTGTHDLEELIVSFSIIKAGFGGDIPGQYHRRVAVTVIYRTTNGANVTSRNVAVFDTFYTTFTDPFGDHHIEEPMEDWSDVTWYTIPPSTSFPPACNNSGAMTCEVKKP